MEPEIVYRIQIYSQVCKEWQQSFYDDIEVLCDTEEAKLSALKWLEEIKQVRSNYDWRLVKMVTTCKVVSS